MSAEISLGSVSPVYVDRNAPYGPESLLGQGTFCTVYKHNNQAHKFITAEHNRYFFFIRELANSVLLKQLVGFVKIIDYEAESKLIVSDMYDQNLYDWIMHNKTTSNSPSLSNLPSICVRDNTLSIRIYIFISILKAISELHKISLIHGDIKMDNVLLRTHIDGKLEVVLCDFGNVSSTEYFQVKYITPMYRNPNDKPDISNDIFSLGVLAVLLFSPAPDKLSLPESYSKLDEQWQFIIKNCICDQHERWSADKLLFYIQKLYVDDNPSVLDRYSKFELSSLVQTKNNDNFEDWLLPATDKNSPVDFIDQFAWTNYYKPINLTVLKTVANYVWDNNLIPTGIDSIDKINIKVHCAVFLLTMILTNEHNTRDILIRVLRSLESLYPKLTIGPSDVSNIENLVPYMCHDHKVVHTSLHNKVRIFN